MLAIYVTLVNIEFSLIGIVMVDEWGRARMVLFPEYLPHR